MLDEKGEPSELGRGAMGVTYKALDVDLRCPVTLKVISERYLGDESARLRFLREARAAASVRHPNVASVLHLGRTGSSYFYAMEFVQGETLESLIKRSGQLELKLALEITTQVAAGLAAVDKAKLVHRDIKPSNIMVSLEEGGGVTAKIIDLGLAKGVGEVTPQSAISAPGGFAGTPEFASPEQFAGIGVDIRSDLYSLGVTLWEMLTGHAPFRGTPAELIYQHQHGVLPLEQLKSVPKQVTALLEMLLDKDPKQRFQTPVELVKTLSTVTTELEKPANQKQEVRTPLVPKVSSRRKRSGRAKPQERSVAVLPFESLSASKRDTYFADGVQDEILSNLARISQLKVISRSSVMTYRPAASRDLRSIATALGVARVIEGTVRRSGNRVRIATRLVDAQTGETLWSDSYDRDLTDIFAIQSEIARNVAARLSAQLSPEERKDIERKPTANLEAYDLYLQAKQLANSVVMWANMKETYLKAISLLEEAIQRDPEFALAYCLMAKANDYLYKDQMADHTPERRALGDAAVNEALRLRPDLPESHLATARHLYICYRDFERARVQIAIAARALSNSPDLLHLTALIDQVLGRWEKSIAGLEKAATLDPRNPDVLYDLAWTYKCLRRYRDNERILDRLVELEPGEPRFPFAKAQSVFAEKADLKALRAAWETLPLDNPGTTRNRIYLAMCARDFAAAKQILSKSLKQDIVFTEALVPRRIYALWLELVQGNRPTMEEFGGPREELYRKVQADPSNPFLMTALALADVALGRKEESIQEGRRAMRMLPISEDAVEGPTIAANVALVYSWANQPDLAFELLNTLIRMPGWRINFGDLKTYPGWDPLRKDPRFAKLLAQLAPKTTLTVGRASKPEKLWPASGHGRGVRQKAAGVTKAPERSVAVLPFDSLSDDRADTYFADGVQDEILSTLAKVSQLKVISRTSVMTYRSTPNRNLRSIAAALGVARIVEGTVRRGGNRLRITTRLVNAQTDNTLWSETYDREIKDIFAIQSDIAQTVAMKLSARLSPTEQRAIEERPTDNMAAFDLYLRAKDSLTQLHSDFVWGFRDGLLSAVKLLEEATRKDPRFVLAYCTAAEAHAYLYHSNLDRTPKRRSLADSALNEALRLRSDLFEVNLAAATHLYFCYRNYDRARVHLSIAERTRPNNSKALALAAKMDRRQGHWEESTRSLEKAIAMDPRNGALLSELATNYECLRQYEVYEQIYERLIELRPDKPTLIVMKALGRMEKEGDLAEFLNALESLPSPTREDAEVTSMRISAAIYARDWKAAIEILKSASSERLPFVRLPFGGPCVPLGMFPRQCFEILITRLQGNNPTADDFSGTRDDLNRMIEADPEDDLALSALGIIDAALGQKERAIEEAQRAVELVPFSRDAQLGQLLIMSFAKVFALTNEPDLALKHLAASARTPGGISYGELKLDPIWDSIRADPRFGELLAELAPRE